MKALSHIIGQPFVFATGLAALVHSTWALGTLFAGEQPEGWHLVGWLVPALLIAFALDVGQIVTSYDIRNRGLTWARGFTFAVFALATYYLQWLYIAHHMPALELAPGVRESWSSLATLIRDSAVWVIPALLPLSTLLYTLSGGETEQRVQAPVERQDAPPLVAPIDVHPPLLESEIEPSALGRVNGHGEDADPLALSPAPQEVTTLGRES